MKQHGLGAAFFAGTVAETQRRGYNFFEEFETFAKAPGKALHSLKFPDTILESFFREFLRFVHSICENEEAWEEKRAGCY